MARLCNAEALRKTLRQKCARAILCVLSALCNTKNKNLRRSRRFYKVKGFMAKILILCIPFSQNGLSSSESRRLIVLVEAERRSREAPNGISVAKSRFLATEDTEVTEKENKGFLFKFRYRQDFPGARFFPVRRQRGRRP